MRDKIPGLLRSCLAANPITDFPLEPFCHTMGAEAGTFWLKGEYDENEMVLLKWHNRPDLDEGHGRIAFSLRDSFMSVCANADHEPFVMESVGKLKQMKWASENLKSYAADHFSECLFIAFKNNRTNISAIISLYYIDEIINVNRNELVTISVEIGTFIETFTRELKLIMIERRKIGHEIARMLAQADGKLDNLSRKIGKSAKHDDAISDLKKAITSASEAASNETFIEGVLNRRRYARRVNLRKEVVAAFHLAISEFGKSYSLIYDNSIRSNLMINISQNDLSLLLSNIASNAVKYTIKGGVILIKHTVMSSTHTITISNMSKPLSRRDLERVWRFGLRGDNSSGVPGEGIGLTIVGDICSAYDIQRSMSQRRSKDAVWTDVSLSFPPKMCSDALQREGVKR